MRAPVFLPTSQGRGSLPPLPARAALLHQPGTGPAGVLIPPPQRHVRAAPAPTTNRTRAPRPARDPRTPHPTPGTKDKQTGKHQQKAFETRPEWCIGHTCKFVRTGVQGLGGVSRTPRKEIAKVAGAAFTACAFFLGASERATRRARSEERDFAPVSLIRAGFHATAREDANNQDQDDHDRPQPCCHLRHHLARW